MTSANTTPGRAIVLARISDARNGDERGVTDQAADCAALAQRLGWRAGPSETHVIIENDTSAFKRKMITLPDGSKVKRTVRPGFRRALGMLASGEADGMLAYDLDRTARDPRDLEDLIDVVESRRPLIPVESVSGSLRLANDADITMARVMVAVANKSSRDTGRRVARARERQAAKGAFSGGVRPFGFARDGITLVPAEAAEIAKAAAAILNGASLRQVTRDFRDSGVPAVKGGSWATGTIRDILMRPRNAGFSTYRGEITGQGQWPAILTEDDWRALCAVLSDPARRTSPGSQPRWLGSLIYKCGLCDGETLWVTGGRNRAPYYACRSGGGHLARSAARLDGYVTDLITGRLARPDAAELLVQRPARSAGAAQAAAALRESAAGLRDRMGQLATAFADGAIDDGALRAGTERLRVRLAEAEAQIESVDGPDPLAGIAGRADAAEVWRPLGIERRRAILRVLLDVTVHKGRPGRLPSGGYFDHDSVEVIWKTG